jgi:hypothetical protein
VNKPNAEFYIDKTLIAVAIRTGISFAPISGPPYIIFGSDKRSFDEATAFIEFSNTDVDKYYLSPADFRVMSGDPLPPRAYLLYLTGTNTKLAGYSISSGSVISHPIPTYGYEKKTLYFMVNQPGTLEVQVYTISGNWRTYESISISANTLLIYSIDNVVVLTRVVFTPSTYPATILVAEMSMS